MPIHFDFVLEDVDAENIFNVLQNHVRHSKFEVLLEEGRTQAEIDWHRRHAEYFEGVIEKMLKGNHQVNE
jgi:hypothetical protein